MVYIREIQLKKLERGLLNRRMVDIFFYILRLGFGTDVYSDFPDLTDEQWGKIIKLSNHQSLIGFLVSGIEKLPAEKRPKKMILMTLLKQCMAIEEMNKRLNIATAKAYLHYAEEGFDPMVMKGQGNCIMYENGMRRMPGDIDLWLRNPYNKKHDKEYQENGITIELHRSLSFTYNPFLNRKLRKLYNEWKDLRKTVVLPNTETLICVPSDEMNLVYLLLHKYRHFLTSGIGMKQMLDYMMLLRKGYTKEEKSKCVDTIKNLHLTGFCRAVMFVMKEKLALEDRFLLMEPDEKLGRFLFNEIMTTGNFGFYDSRYNDSKSFMDKYRIKRKFFMIWKFPYDLLWYPYWKIEKIIRK